MNPVPIPATPRFAFENLPADRPEGGDAVVDGFFVRAFDPSSPAPRWGA